MTCMACHMRGGLCSLHQKGGPPWHTLPNSRWGRLQLHLGLRAESSSRRLAGINVYKTANQCDCSSLTKLPCGLSTAQNWHLCMHAPSRMLTCSHVLYACMHAHTLTCKHRQNCTPTDFHPLLSVHCKDCGACSYHGICQTVLLTRYVVIQISGKGTTVKQ